MSARLGLRPTLALQQQLRRRYQSGESPTPPGNNFTVWLGLGCAVMVAFYLHLRKSHPIRGTSDPWPAFSGGDQGFLTLELARSELVNPNTRKLTFAMPGWWMESGLEAASALLAKHKGPEMEKPVIRPYTPISDPTLKGTMDIIVKKYPNGPMSTYMHDMKHGQTLDFKGPVPKYKWEADKHEHLVMIAGGTGITPMYQVLRAIHKNPDDRTKVTLIYANVSEEDIILKKELQELENMNPRAFRVFYVLDNPPESWQGGKGRVTRELLKTLLPEPKLGDALKIFVCGPPGMYKAICGSKKSPSDQGELTGMLEELGYNKKQVYKF